MCACDCNPPLDAGAVEVVVAVTGVDIFTLLLAISCSVDTPSIPMATFAASASAAFLVPCTPDLYLTPFTVTVEMYPAVSSGESHSYVGMG